MMDKANTTGISGNYQNDIVDIVMNKIGTFNFMQEDEKLYGSD
jgi:hypothetical protein